MRPTRHPPHPDTVYAGSSAGTIYRSSDRGQTWEEFASFPGGSVTGVGLDPSTPRRIYAAVRGVGFQFSENGGASWEERELGSNGYFGLAVNLADGSRLLVSTGGIIAPGDRAIFKSIDAGRTWSLKAGCTPTRPAFDAADTNYAYTGQYLDWGLWRSTDGGETWNPLSNLPGVAGFTYAAVDPREGKLWMSRAGMGVFLSTNHGEDWLDMSGSLVNRIIDDVAVEPLLGGRSPLVAAICTEGDGVHTAYDALAAVEPEAGPTSCSQVTASIQITGVPDPFL
ncbi:MAG: hypothetical protein KAY24_01890, partial [Candidatus Eisenbacteria sp.]|nr:hypothetical protein [Candidatus Eisenbacteria bacterium]